MYSHYPTSPVPAISIDFAPIEDPVPEPRSPFSSHSDSYSRASSLHVPSVLSPRAAERHQQQQKDYSQGLERARFELMLQATRERSASAKKQLDLRKEVAYNAHQTRQADRRALFLSKIIALPDPTATSTPVTPPESPAVFHFTLPSPGLVSPLALFESLESLNATNIRTEHVDFRARAKKDAEAMAAITRNVKQSMEINGLSGNYQPVAKAKPAAKTLPSLAQISARLSATSNVSTTRAPTTNSRLPAFLRTREATPPKEGSVHSDDTVRAAPASRLPAFLARVKTPPPATSVPVVTSPRINICRPTTPPAMDLTPSNPQLLDKRARHGKDMVDRLRRRVSAPAELTGRQDLHPILKVPGGF